MILWKTSMKTTVNGLRRLGHDKYSNVSIEKKTGVWCYNTVSTSNWSTCWHVNKKLSLVPKIFKIFNHVLNFNFTDFFYTRYSRFFHERRRPYFRDWKQYRVYFELKYLLICRQKVVRQSIFFETLGILHYRIKLESYSSYLETIWWGKAISKTVWTGIIINQAGLREISLIL